MLPWKDKTHNEDSEKFTSALLTDCAERIFMQRLGKEAQERWYDA